MSVAVVAALATGCGATSDGTNSDAAVRVTLAVEPFGRTPLTPPIVADVLTTLEHRLGAAGIHGSATTAGDQLVLSVPAATVDRVKALATQVGVLRFRRVLEVGKYSPSGSAFATAAPGTISVQPLASGESPALAAGFEKTFAEWNCADSSDPTNGNDLPSDYVIACDASGGDESLKYLLAPTAVEGNEIHTASAGLDAVGHDWQVNLQFTGPGGRDFLAVTKESYDATGSTATGFGTCAPPKGCNAIAIVLDGVVESAPAIISPGGIPGGIAQITGNYDETEATNLADILKYGALPARLLWIS